MTRELVLGYRKKIKPKNLESVLKGRGFELKETIEADAHIPFETQKYHLFNRRSEQGVWYIHEGGILGSQAIAQAEKLVALGKVITYVGSSIYDLKVQDEVAVFLQRHYNTVLHDPNEDRILMK